jgi:DME family drug/metabolite transporter
VKVSKHWHGYAFATVAAALWATIGLFGKFLFRYALDPIAIVTLRAIIAATTLGLGLAIIRPRLLRIDRRDLPSFAIYGLIGVALNYSCYFLALRWTTMTTAAVLLYTYPALVVVGAFFFLNESFERKKVMALLIAMIGSFLVAQGYDIQAIRLNLPGVLFSLGASATMASYCIYGKRFVERYSSWTITFYAIGFGALALTLLQSTKLSSSLSYPWQAWCLILGLAWGPTLLAYASFTFALNFIEAGRASIIATLEPALAALLGFLVLHESTTSLQWGGGAMILGSVLLLHRRQVD